MSELDWNNESDAAKTIAWSCGGHDPAALDLAAEAESGQNSGANPGGDVYAGMAYKKDEFFQRLLTGLQTSTKYDEEKNSLVL